MIKNDEVAKKSTLVDYLFFSFRRVGEGAIFFSYLFSFRLKPHRDAGSLFLTFLLAGSATLIVRVTDMWPCEGTNRLRILVIW